MEPWRYRNAFIIIIITVIIIIIIRSNAGLHTHMLPNFFLQLRCIHYLGLAHQVFMPKFILLSFLLSVLQFS